MTGIVNTGEMSANSISVTVDISTKRTHINLDTFPKAAYTAVVKVRYQSSVRVGAGMSQSQAVAIGLAFRAAIQNLLTT